MPGITNPWQCLSARMNLLSTEATLQHSMCSAQHANGIWNITPGLLREWNVLTQPSSSLRQQLSPKTTAKSLTHRPRVQPATSNAVLSTPSPGAASRGRQTDTPNPGAEETEWQFAEDEDDTPERADRNVAHQGPGPWRDTGPPRYPFFCQIEKWAGV